MPGRPGLYGGGGAVYVIDLRVNLAGLQLKNPVMVASGTFGYGEEFAEFFDLSLLGAIMVKGVSLKPWEGNPTPRTAETPAGMLNAIGLQNPGVEAFINEHLPFLSGYDTKIIVNIVGKSVEEYAEVAGILDKTGVDAVEINISCPNIKQGGIQFGTDPQLASQVVSAVKSATSKPVITKLSPNVGDIILMAKAVEEAGTDIISLINTLQGMAIDIHTRKPKLANTFGGLSGPAVRPIAVRMVWQVYESVNVPIIGMGGIVHGEDAIEFILAGAGAVAVGTANFLHPLAAIRVLEGIQDYLQKERLTYSKLIGLAHRSE
jgi:dihydroorotate dehydrogenase (NAD+) catalytic subunit